MRFAMAAFLLSGCTLATDLDEYSCESDSDCSPGRICSANNLCLLSSMAPECGPADPCPEGELCSAGRCEAEESVRFGCVGAMSESPIVSSSKVTLRMQLHARANGGVPSPSRAVTAVACALPACDDTQGPFTPDDSGMLEVVVAQGFDGFVKLTGEGFIDTFYQLQAPLNADSAVAVDVTMLTATDVTELARAADANASLDRRGVVLLQLTDCVGGLSEDVAVTDLTPNAAEKVVYLEDDMSKVSSTGATSGAGLAMALGAVSGTVEFGFETKTSSIDLGSLAVTTVAGAITYAPYQVGR